MPRLFRKRPWHPPGAVAALVAFVLGAVSGVVVLHGAASAAPSDRPTITLSQSTDLVNQRVKVSWSGFLPNQFALGIYQCKGTVPTARSCDGVNDQRPDPDKPGGLAGPVIGHQALFGLTGSRGDAWFRVMPKSDRPYLGCDDDTPCVLAVVLRPHAAATRDDFRPADTTFSNGVANVPTDRDFALALEVGQAAYTPISFATEPESCTNSRAALRVSGNSEHAMAGLSWLGGLCGRATAPMTMTVSASSSQEGRDAFRAGSFDAAVTSQPLGGPSDQVLSAAPSGIPGRRSNEIVYAPLTNSAIVVAMNLERLTNGNTGVETVEPVNLTPRLVAKLLTDAYATSREYATGAWPGRQEPGRPPQYISSIYFDPEFLAANPGRTWPDSDPHPLLVRGVNDDTVHELTRWLLSDPATAEWLAGKPDEFGIACPDVWRTGAVLYPFSLIINRLEQRAWDYRPVGSYWSIVDNLVRSQGPEVRDRGTGGQQDLKPVDPDQFGNHRVLAVTSLEAAERMKLPVAKLRNAAGQFVAPTSESVTAGVAAATPGPDGVTLSNDFAAKDPKAYPLVTTDVAAMPNQGLTQPVADALGTYLEYVAGDGQKPGVALGQLPPGYVPLTAKQKQQVAAAREMVRKAVGDPGKPPPSSPPPDNPPGTTGGHESFGSAGSDTTGGSGRGDGTPAGGTSGGAGGSSASAGSGASTGGAPPGASPSATIAPKPAAATAPSGGGGIGPAIADRIRQALAGDPASILLVVLMLVAFGSAVASPVLLGVGWRRRTGRWPPPVAALLRTIRRGPAGGAG